MPLEILDGVFGMDHPLMGNSGCAGRDLSTRDPVYHLRWSRGLDGTSTSNGREFLLRNQDWRGMVELIDIAYVIRMGVSLHAEVNVSR
jgi:hypothetical protein